MSKQRKCRRSDLLFLALLAAGFLGAGIFAQDKPGEGVWANYDFKPGDRVIFAEDFSADAVGNFPQRLEFIEGNMEVVDWKGEKHLRATSPALFAVHLPEKLPDKFTIEFTVFWEHANHILRILPQVETKQKLRPTLDGWYPKAFITVDERGTGLDDRRSGGGKAQTRVIGKIRGGPVPVRVMADGSYMKVYVDEQRVANVPNAAFERSDRLWFAMPRATEQYPVFLGPIRIAAGGRDIYQALEETGRVATQGIYFDLNSATVRPESTAALNEIGAMLKEHPDLRIRIEGHTDSMGEDAYNMKLSQQRAEAVRETLIRIYAIDAGRLEAQGFGESKPAGTNDTPEGRQNNRRVELVKLTQNPL